MVAGAFESNRILLNSNLLENIRVKFSDHLSQKDFKISNTTQIGNQDFKFLINKSSLITKRIVGEIDGISYLADPVYNSEFGFFKILKKYFLKVI